MIAGLLWIAAASSGQTGAAAQGPNRTKERLVAAIDAGRVTSTYLRLHSPETILSWVQAVKEGKLPAAELQGLVGPDTLAALLKAPNGAFSRGSATIQASRSGNPKGPKPTLPRADHSAWASAMGAAGLKTLKPIVDYAPKRMDFPALSDGQSADQLLLLISPTDGPINLKLPLKEKNFQIVEMRLYGGKVADRRLSSGALWPGPVFARRSQAPWQMVASAGQSVGVVVRFAPKLNFVTNGAGMKASTLAIDGKHWNAQHPKQPPWHVEVPLSGRFLGVSLGVIGFPEVSDVDVVTPDSYRPSEPQPFQAPLVLINTKEAVSGVIRPLRLPRGISMNPLPVSLSKGQTKTVPIPFSIDRNDRSGVWGQPEIPHEIVLEGSFGGKTFQTCFSVVIYPSSHVWSFNGVDVGSCTVAGDFVLRGSGLFNFSASADNHDLIAGRQVLFRGGFDGSDSDVNMVLAPKANDVDYRSYGFFRQAYKDQYNRYIGLPLPVRVTVK